jgi:cytochrome c biogenesis protein CcmG, thiol:disulfide interchange protein DsbE
MFFCSWAPPSAAADRLGKEASLRFRLPVGFVFVLTLFVLSGCTGKKEKADDTRRTGSEGATQMTQFPKVPLIELNARRAAPDIQATCLDGAPWRLADRKGKVVIIDFWATWCGPCRRTIPHMIDLQREFEGRGLEIVGISLDQGGSAVVSPFVKETGINYPIIVEQGPRWASLFEGVDGIPTFFLIDRQGRTAGRMVGAMPKEMIVQAVESLLKEG